MLFFRIFGDFFSKESVLDFFKSIGITYHEQMSSVLSIWSPNLGLNVSDGNLVFLS